MSSPLYSIYLVKRNSSQQSSRSDSPPPPVLSPRNCQRKTGSSAADMGGSQVKRRTPSLYDNPPGGNMSNKRPNDIHFYQNMNGPDWKRLVEAGYDNLRIPPRRSRSVKSSSPVSSSSSSSPNKGFLDFFVFMIFMAPHPLIASHNPAPHSLQGCYHTLACRCMKLLLQNCMLPWKRWRIAWSCKFWFACILQSCFATFNTNMVWIVLLHVVYLEMNPFFFQCWTNGLLWVTCSNLHPLHQSCYMYR